MQIKTPGRSSLYLSFKTFYNQKDSNRCWWGWGEKLEPWTPLRAMENGCNPFGENKFVGFLESETSKLSYDQFHAKGFKK